MRLITLLALLLVACGAQVRPDPSPINAIDANYPTLEMYACNKTWHGVGICRVKPGQNFQLIIQGYFTGTIRIASPNCNIAQTVSYKDSQKIKVNVPGNSGNCVIVATMSPRFPNGDNGVEVSSLRGYFAIRRDSLPNQWVGRAVKLPLPGYGNLRLPVGPITGGNTILNGCGRDYNEPNSISGKVLTVPFRGFVNSGGTTGACVADGAVFSPEYQALLVNVLVVSYSSNLNPLAIPLVDIADGEITVTADPAVSAVAVDNIFKVATRGVFPFDPKINHVVRAITAKGRSVIGLWVASEQEFIWQQ